MPLVQTYLRKIRNKSALCAQNVSLNILLQINLRLRVCLAMCLKYGRFQSKSAYKARAYKKNVLALLQPNSIYIREVALDRRVLSIAPICCFIEFWIKQWGRKFPFPKHVPGKILSRFGPPTLVLH